MKVFPGRSYYFLLPNTISPFPLSFAKLIGKRWAFSTISIPLIKPTVGTYKAGEIFFQRLYDRYHIFELYWPCDTTKDNGFLARKKCKINRQFSKASARINLKRWWKILPRTTRGWIFSNYEYLYSCEKYYDVILSKISPFYLFERFSNEYFIKTRFQLLRRCNTEFQFFKTCASVYRDNITYFTPTFKTMNRIVQKSIMNFILLKNSSKRSYPRWLMLRLKMYRVSVDEMLTYALEKKLMNGYFISIVDTSDLIFLVENGRSYLPDAKFVQNDVTKYRCWIHIPTRNFYFRFRRCRHRIFSSHQLT